MRLPVLTTVSAVALAMAASAGAAGDMDKSQAEAKPQLRNYDAGVDKAETPARATGARAPEIENGLPEELATSPAASQEDLPPQRRDPSLVEEEDIEAYDASDAGVADQQAMTGEEEETAGDGTPTGLNLQGGNTTGEGESTNLTGADPAPDDAPGARME